MPYKGPLRGFEKQQIEFESTLQNILQDLPREQRVQFLEYAKARVSWSRVFEKALGRIKAKIEHHEPLSALISVINRNAFHGPLKAKDARNLYDLRCAMTNIEDDGSLEPPLRKAITVCKNLVHAILYADIVLYGKNGFLEKDKDNVWRVVTKDGFIDLQVHEPG